MKGKMVEDRNKAIQQRSAAAHTQPTQALLLRRINGSRVILGLLQSMIHCARAIHALELRAMQHCNELCTLSTIGVQHPSKEAHLQDAKHQAILS